MKKLMKKAFVLLLIVSIISSVFSVSVFAESLKTADLDFYAVNYDEIVKRTPYMTNGVWKTMLTPTKIDNGIRLEFKEAVKNLRAEAYDSVSMDGFHAVFSGLEGAEGTKIAFTFTQRQAYSAYFDQTVIDILAWIPLAFVLNTEAGTLDVRQGKAYHNNDNNVNFYTAIKSDSLKMDSLKNKEWDFSLKLDEKDLTDENDDEWIISIAGESASVSKSHLFATSCEIDYKKCFFAINSVNEMHNNFSVNWHTVHSGDNTCADNPESQKLLDAAKVIINKIDTIDTVTYDKGELISSIRTTYDNMSFSMQTLIKNYETFCIKEKAYSFVKKIAELETVSLDSESVINDIDNDFAKLSDEEKLNVTNYSDFVEYKKSYLKLATDKALSETYTIEKEIPVKSGSHTEITNTVDVEGETIVKKVTETVTTSGMDGSQYLWIIFTGAGIILLILAAVFIVLFLKNHKRRKNNA